MWVSRGSYSKVARELGPDPCSLHLEEAVWDFSDSALWDFSDPHQSKVVFPPIPPQPLGFSFPPPLPRDGSRCHQSPPCS